MSYITSLGHIHEVLSLWGDKTANNNETILHDVWYGYVVYLVNMVVVDGYVLSWRQAINSMMMHVRCGSV